ncbi:MAG: DUF2796 domain-containing protein [Xanthomonadales bacterium]|nr:DUF2796 domain-containing protein [Xanthomonadales bacterium]
MTRLLPTVLLLASGVAGAQVEHQHGAHVHGVAQATLVVAEGTLALELTVPGMDLIGFEHAPRDEGDRARIEAALATLEASAQWLAFEPAGSCVVVHAEAHTHGYKAVTHADDEPKDAHGHHAHASEPASDAHPHGHGHDHGKDHDHDHDHGDGHGEFHLELRGTCSGRPGHAVLSLDRHFEGLGTVRIDLIAGDRQDRVELPHGRGRVDLR